MSFDDERLVGGGRTAEGSIHRWGGSVRAGRGEGLVPARFAWFDEVSGERLLVDFIGTECFFRELEALGFERQAGEAGLDEDEPGLRAGRPSALTVVREAARRPA
jgi:hypothetical protein